MAKNIPEENHRPNVTGANGAEQAPSSENLKDFLKRKIEEGRFWNQKIFDGRDGKKIDLDQVLEEM
jgi:hypothetical protein